MAFSKRRLINLFTGVVEKMASDASESLRRDIGATETAYPKVTA